MTEPQLWGQPFLEADKHLGHLKQCVRIDSLTYDNGPERGSRLVRVVSGGGLTLDVHPDRSLDLGQVEIFGVPLAWMSPTSIAHPGLVSSRGKDFLRTFGGGLLATCGLDHFGGPVDEDGLHYPQHGRVGGIPATLTGQAVDPSRGLVVTGHIAQAAVHQENLTLERELVVPLGSTEIHLTDKVKNHGTVSQPHMILYHCNFGWPLLSPASQVTVTHQEVEPFTADAANEPWNQLGPPTCGQQERCWLHTLTPKQAVVALRNSKLGIEMAMHIDSTTLPGLCEWKMLAEKQYVLGLEPTNTLDLGGRIHAKEQHKLKMLEPGEEVTYRLQWKFKKI